MVAREQAVQPIATGKCGQSRLLPRDRTIFLSQKTAQGAIGRIDLPLGDAGEIAADAAAFGVRNCFGKLADRVHERRLIDRLRQQRIDLHDHVVHRQRGLGHATGHAFAEARDGLCEHLIEDAVPRD